MTENIELTPFESVQVSKHQIPAHGRIPNTSIQNKPLLIYHHCIRSTPSPAIIERHLEDVGVVIPQWRYTMYSTSHFHSTTHEVLCISRGSAKLLFGGEGNPSKVEMIAEKGDVIIIPAGVSHRLISDIQGDFEMVGSYPPGASWDMCYGKDDEKHKIARIQDVSWFQRDPLYGDQGPVLEN